MAAQGSRSWPQPRSSRRVDLYPGSVVAAGLAAVTVARVNDVRGPKRTGDLTDEQATRLVESFTETLTETWDIVRMLSDYAQAGGRDWKTYERLLDHWARHGLKMVFAGRGALRPELGAVADQRIAEATGNRNGEAGMRALVHSKLAGAVLAMVWYAGEHHPIEAEAWPEDLATVVLDAVRQAPRINTDPMMDNL